MKMDLVAGSQNDEFYTPAYAVEPILEYIPSQAKVWCPFDTEDSFFVKMLRERGSSVYATHISNSKYEDFFEIARKDNIIPRCEYIVSNPPYSKKTEVLEILFDIGIPFAMLVGFVGLFESKRRFDFFSHNFNSFELMVFNKRVAYLKSYDDPKPSLNPPFSSVYVCHSLLPHKFIFKELNKCNS